jgi:hypothetical protein
MTRFPGDESDACKVSLRWIQTIAAGVAALARVGIECQATPAGSQSESRPRTSFVVRTETSGGGLVLALSSQDSRRPWQLLESAVPLEGHPLSASACHSQLGDKEGDRAQWVQPCPNRRFLLLGLITPPALSEEFLGRGPSEFCLALPLGIKIQR